VLAVLDESLSRSASMLGTDSRVFGCFGVLCEGLVVSGIDTVLVFACWLDQKPVRVQARDPSQAAL
jgi:hypothetical protein